MKSELMKIKKYYGEEMMHLVSKLFPTILEEENCLFTLLMSKFAPNKALALEIKEHNLVQEFQDYIYSLWNPCQEYISTTKTPKELLNDAGYDFYECHMEEDIQRFKKYYADGEKLCTFRGNRLEICYVFFAVKKDVDNIKRSDFKTPKREDKYGTSVISIQFTKGKVNTLSIKNRYNHAVDNPDATFQNNLDNIIPGLTDSFAKEYNLNINSNINNFGITEYSYVIANDKKFYRYIYEQDNIYFCLNNIIIDNGKVINTYTDKAKYIIFDNYILDLMNKEFILYKPSFNNSFLNDLKNITKIYIEKLDNNSKKINIVTDKGTIYITIDNLNRIICYENKYIEKLDNNFLRYSKNLKTLVVPNVKKVGNYVLFENKNIEKLSMPKVKKIGIAFLQKNEIISDVYLPEVEEISDNFLRNNRNLKVIYLPQVRQIDNDFLFHNQHISECIMPKLEVVGDFFLEKNHDLKELTLPNLKRIGAFFISSNFCMQKISLPKVEKIKKSFLENNYDLTSISFPMLTEVGELFMMQNNNLVYLNLPNILIIEGKFLIQNEVLETLIIPKVKKIGDYSFFSNKNLKELVMPINTKYTPPLFETHPEFGNQEYLKEYLRRKSLCKKKNI